MAQDPDLRPNVAPAQSAEAGRPNVVEEAGSDAYDPAAVDKKYWSACLEDAERAERDWRERGRQIVQIYRNEYPAAKPRKTGGGVTFNILFANTEVMLPAIYQKPPEPVVRSRFTSIAEPTVPMMPVTPPGVGAMGGPPGVPPPPAPLVAPPGGPMPPNAGAPPAPPPMSVTPAGPTTQPAGPIGGGLPPPPPIAGAGMAVPPAVPPPPNGFGLPIGGGGMPIPGAPGPMGMPPPPISGPEPAPGRPAQRDIETAASVMEKALEIVVDDEHSHEAMKAAIKDMLLPGRGVCRVRWKPQMKTVDLPGGPLPDGTQPTEDRKVWEEVDDEYVYWEDFLCDPVRAVPDMNWIAFRHLFTRAAADTEFADSAEYQARLTANRADELFTWTDESAAKSPVGGGSAMKTARNLGDHVKKMMAWEIWDRTERRIIWFVRETSGVVLRVDPDTLQLQGFYPIPAPMLAVTTTDSRIPKAFYDLYAKLAADLDEVSDRISNLTKQIKVRGAYNGASRDIADILTAGDNKMVAVEGVDMITGGLAAHIWLMPIDQFMAALDKLLLAKEQLKQSIYEIMGISDIMRGTTKASETATAQRIKGSMGVSRLEDAKSGAGNFVRDLLRLKGEIIAQNFDPATLEAMSGEKVTPEVMAILRSDFLRVCTIDIEADSTVAVDEQTEQQSMTMVMQSIQLVMQGITSLLQVGFLPPPQIIQLGLELLKMALHPVRYSRGVVELINDFQEQLMAAQARAALMPPPAPPTPPPGAPGGEPETPGGPPGGTPPPPPLPNGNGAPMVL